MSNPNTNCLAGMACPGCKSFGPFIIVVTTPATVTDEGIEEYGHGHVDWDDKSNCHCVECDHNATVADFRKE